MSSFGGEVYVEDGVVDLDVERRLRCPCRPGCDRSEFESFHVVYGRGWSFLRLEIEISELMQLVVDHLLFDSPKSLVSLVCTSRALEEQALSTLWSEQSSLSTIIRSTLPPGTLSPSQSSPQVCDSDRRLVDF